MKKKFVTQSLLILVLLILMFQVVYLAVYSMRKSKEYDRIRSHLDNVRSRLEYAVNNNFMIIYNMASHIILNPDIDNEEFSNLAEQFFRQYHNLKNIGMAPDLVLRSVYPLEGNEAILGVDYRDLPGQWEQVRKARDEKRMILAGPLDLVQGGKGLIGRVPVYLGENNDVFWGIVSSVIAFDDLIEPIEEYAGLDGLSIALLDAGLPEKNLIYGNDTVLEDENMVSAEIRLPDRTWTLAASPQDFHLFHSLDVILSVFFFLSLFLILEILLFLSYRKGVALETNRIRFADFVRTSSDWVWECDNEFRIVYSSGTANSIFSFTPEELEGKILFSLMTPETEELARQVLIPSSELSREKKELQWWLPGKDGKQRCFSVSAVAFTKSDRFAGFRGVARDITGQKFTGQQLHSYIEIVDENVPIFQTDLQGVIRKVNKAFCRLFGFAVSELIGKNHKFLKDKEMPDDIYQEMYETVRTGEIWKGVLKKQKKDGSPCWCHTTVRPLYDIHQEHYGYMAVQKDISAERELETLSETDALTELYNRRKLDETLEMELIRCKRLNSRLGLIMFDIDHFKQFNDIYGHLKGDEVLIMVARIVKESIREIDLLGRWGGEEFLLVCPATNRKGAVTLAENLRKKIEESSFDSVGPVTCSFGAVSTDGDIDAVDLMTTLDKALYEAKESGRNCVRTAQKQILNSD